MKWQNQKRISPGTESKGDSFVYYLGLMLQPIIEPTPLTSPITSYFSFHDFSAVRYR